MNEWNILLWSNPTINLALSDERIIYQNTAIYRCENYCDHSLNKSNFLSDAMRRWSVPARVERVSIKIVLETIDTIIFLVWSIATVVLTTGETSGEHIKNLPVIPPRHPLKRLAVRVIANWLSQAMLETIEDMLSCLISSPHDCFTPSFTRWPMSISLKLWSDMKSQD